MVWYPPPSCCGVQINEEVAAVCARLVMIAFRSRRLHFHRSRILSMTNNSCLNISEIRISARSDPDEIPEGSFFLGEVVLVM